LPVSGLGGINIKDDVSPSICPWYSGPSLLNVLENLKPPDRLIDAPLRLPINDKYRDMGTIVMGKLESGTVKKGANLLLMPNKTPIEVQAIYIESSEIERAEPGDNVKLRIRGIEEEDVRCGFILCEPSSLVPCISRFDAQIIILEHKSIICPGYTCVMHIHASVEECTIESLLAIVDRKTNEIIKKKPKFVKPGMTVRARIATHQPVCVEAYKDFQQLGRFMLRDEGKTIGVGVIMKLHSKEKDKELHEDGQKVGDAS